MTAGFVYFIRCGEYVKIGFSTDVDARQRAIAAHTPYDVELVAKHEGTQADEAAFHRLLKAHRHRNEWFRWCEQVERLAATGIADDLRSNPRTQALVAAIDACGSSNELARRLGVTPQALSQWGRVPPLRVLDVERVSGVTRHELRPDMYPPPEPARAAS